MIMTTGGTGGPLRTMSRSAGHRPQYTGNRGPAQLELAAADVAAAEEADGEVAEPGAGEVAAAGPAAPPLAMVKDRMLTGWFGAVLLVASAGLAPLDPIA